MGSLTVGATWLICAPAGVAAEVTMADLPARAVGARPSREVATSHRLMSLVPIAFGFGLLGEVPVLAQPLEESLAPGARVRVTLANETDAAGKGPSLVGRLAEVRPESIVLTTGASEPRELRRDAIVKLERSVHPSRKLKGALIWYGAAFVTFAVAAAAMGTEGACYDLAASECVAVSALIALPAAGIGALVSPGEQWAAVRSDGIRVSLAPTRGHGVSLQVSFVLP